MHADFRLAFTVLPVVGIIILIVIDYRLICYYWLVHRPKTANKLKGCVGVTSGPNIDVCVLWLPLATAGRPTTSEHFYPTMATV